VRVAVTLEQCWHRVPGGTAVAALEVAGRLHDSVEEVGVAAWHRNPPQPPFVPSIPVRQLPLPRPALYDAWGRLGWPRVERATGPVDVVHATTVIVPATVAPLVVTIHDLAFLESPERFTRRGASVMRRHLAHAITRARVVLCSSHATMEACEAAGFDAGRLRHVPLGVSVPTVDADAVAAVRRAFAITRPYVLFLGTLEPRKNLAGLLRAFASLDAGDLQLVVAGPSGWGPAIEADARALGDRVRLTGFVPEAVKHALLAGAAALCYPSLHEGFGLPVAEAMAHGCPVVTSRGTSTEEVAGGAAVLVDPADPTDIARGIAEALDDGSWSARGRARAAELSWDRTAAATLAAYEEAAR
jgi:glycosyltransferase involved in cell wall biosynthesis